MRTRIKICGITQIQSVATLVAVGADAIGLVFYPSSKRLVSLERAQEIRREVPPMMTVFGVFVDAAYDEVMAVVQAGVVDCLQFHGAEPESFCADFPLPYIKAVPMGSLDAPDTYMRPYVESATGFLLDSNQINEPGGSGVAFDWERCSSNVSKPMILSGGLTAQNVGAGIHQVQPYAVDVSSGVEDESAQKNTSLIQAFVVAVQHADQQQEARRST